MVESSTTIGSETTNDSVYMEGFAQGVIDGHNSIFHQSKLKDYSNLDGFGQGYVNGWRSTCKEMGLTVGADSGCELSMDVGTP
jgi:hypothetical protein